MSTKSAFLLTVALIVILTLIWFAYVQYINYNRQAVTWNLLNLLAGITITLTLNSIIPQFFLVGRTEAQCNLIHHWMGTFYNVTNGMVRLLFQCRSNQIAPDTRRDRIVGHLMASVIIGFSVVSAIMCNLTMETMVIQNICIGIPDMVGAVFAVLVVPTAMDIAINIRFFSHILQSTRLMASAMSRKQAKAPIRLLRITCLLCISCTFMSFITTLFLTGFVPLQDRSWITGVLAAEQAYNACALAWPSIYIRVRKRLKLYLKETHLYNQNMSITVVIRPVPKEKEIADQAGLSVEVE